MLMGSLMGLALAASATQVVTAEKVSERVAVRMHDVLQTAGSTAMVRVPVRLRDQVVPAGDMEIVVGEPAGRFPRARMAIPVQIYVSGHLIRTLNVWAEFSDPQNVWVYTADHPQRTAGQLVRIEQRSVDATCCAGVFLDQATSLQNMRLRRPVRAGQPVMLSDLESRPEVESRAPVAVSVRQGNVELALNGVALMDGRVGERISVRTGMSNQAVYGTVVAAGKVSIDD